VNKVSNKGVSISYVKFIEIERYSRVNRIKAVTKLSDTVYLVSRNRKEYEVGRAEFTRMRLAEMNRFRVGTMEVLGAYLIYEGDTLWRGPSPRHAPKFYMILDEDQ